MKKVKQFILRFKLLLFSIIKSPMLFIVFLKHYRNENIYTNETHMKMASDWLLLAQEANKDGGYSRGFYLHKGWDKSYIETTGYIIPTLLNMSIHSHNTVYKKSAFRAGEWLLNIQNKDGSFDDIDNNIKLVFDSGQVMYGLIAIYELGDIKNDAKETYRQAILKLSEWLCDTQDKDGSWTTFGFNGIAHSYYSRVSSILYKTGTLFNVQKFRSFANKHIEWVLASRDKNGFFGGLGFRKNEDAFLHTMIYVLEGLYDYYNLTKNKEVLNALLTNANRLKTINMQREMLLCSQYDTNFNCTNNEKCITGLSQWSNMSFKLYSLTKDSDYLLVARKTLYYLKSKQFKNGKNLSGSLPGSVPFWGEYAPYSAVNWGVKFFIDALLENDKHQLSLINDSSLWIEECFKFKNNVVDEIFTTTSKEYLQTIELYVKKSNNILDVGCGKGKYIQYFQKSFKNKTIHGVDPCFFDNKVVKYGSAYSIDFDKKFDLIYTIEVLQHIKYLDYALQEIYSKLSDNGYFIICDRNPNSFIGYLKPLQEYRNKWMYPFDSPFIEKWYSIKSWTYILNRCGFTIENIKTFNSKNGKLGWMNKYNIIIARKR